METTHRNSYFCGFILFTSFAFMNETAAQTSYVKLFNDGQYKEVINAVSQIDSSSRKAEDWFYLGQSYSAVNDISNARDSFKEAVAKRPDNKGYRLMYCRALNQSGKIFEATANYDTLVSSDSTFTPALSELGMIYIDNKEYKKSLPLFEKLASLNKKDFKSRYYAAYAMFQNGLGKDDTIKFFKHLVQSSIANFSYIPALELHAVYLYNLGNYNGAYFTYDEIAKIRQTDPEPYYKAGICLEKIKLMVAAIIRFKKAAELDSTVFAYQSHLGYAYFVNGNVDSAIIAFKKSLLLNKDNPTIYLNLGMAYMNLDSLATAKVYLEKALQNTDVNQIVMMQNQLAYVNLKLNNAKEAKTYCEKVLLMEPKDVYAQFNLAKSFDMLGNKRAAASNYSKAIPLLESEEKLKKELEFSKQRLSELQRKDK